MKFSELIEKMNLYTLSAVRCSDLAISAGKLMLWNCEEWDKEPCLASARNMPDIKMCLPLVQGVSTELSKTLYLILGNPESCTFSENGGVYFGHVDTFISPNEIIATQVMLYNYCLLEAYEFDLMKQKIYENQELFFDEKYSLKDFNERGFEKLINGVVERELVKYERQSVEKRLNLWKKFDLNEIGEKWIEIYKVLSERRNELTHEHSPTKPTLEESIIYFHHCRVLAKEIATKFGDKSISECKVPWHDFKEVEMPQEI